jgi:tol-pal system protein YbgF
MKNDRSIMIQFILVFFIFTFISCSAFNINRTAESPADKTDDQLASMQTTSNESAPLESRLRLIQQDLDSMSEQITAQQSVNDDLSQKIEHLESQIAELKKQTSAPKFESKLADTASEPLYQKARNLMLEGDYNNASALFTELIKKHPTDSLADNAMYWLGECHYSSAEFKTAIDVFKDLEKKYPKSEKVPDSLLKIGYAYLSLDDSNRAHHYLKLVLKKYPFSPAAEKAQDKLKEFD